MTGATKRALRLPGSVPGRCPGTGLCPLTDTGASRMLVRVNLGHESAHAGVSEDPVSESRNDCTHSGYRAAHGSREQRQHTVGTCSVAVSTSEEILAGDLSICSDAFNLTTNDRDSCWSGPRERRALFGGKEKIGLVERIADIHPLSAIDIRQMSRGQGRSVAAAWCDWPAIAWQQADLASPSALRTTGATHSSGYADAAYGNSLRRIVALTLSATNQRQTC